jgi:predicted DNA-binding transcriptional regulator YafY
LRIPTQGRHRAMVDVEATTAVFDHLLKVLQDRGVRTLEGLLAAQGGPVPWEHTEEIALPPDLADALTGEGAVWIRYESSTGQLTERVIRPIRVAPGPGDVLYLEAHCYPKAELRYFRVDRITQVRPADDEIGLDCQLT